MGYYSEVAITLYETDFKTLIKRAEKEATGALNLIECSELYKNNKNNSVSMFWSCVKWYEDSKDISFIMSFIRSDDIQYQFKRVGEDIGDIEEEWRDEDWILGEAAHIERFISIDYACTTVDSLEKMFQREPTLENIDNDSVNEVSEEELIAIISA